MPGRFPRLDPPLVTTKSPTRLSALRVGVSCAMLPHDGSLSAMRGYADLLESRGVGYSQGDRWSFNPARDGLFVYSMSNCDCSSSCGAIGRVGGINFDTRDPFYTGNFASKAKNVGCELISVSNFQ